MPAGIPLHCLPFAGAGASFYFPWRRLAVRGVDIRPLQLPGRERRIAEPPYTDVGVAVEGLLPQVLETGESGPVALFGHSMGAILAFELALRVSEAGRVVAHLFVSGSQGPWRQRVQRATGLDDEEFVIRIQEFAGYRHPAFEIPDIRDVLLPALRADVQMHESYTPMTGRTLPAPICSIRGIEDHLVSAEAAANWAEATTSSFTSVEMPGGHMYLDEEPGALLRVLTQML